MSLASDLQTPAVYISLQLQCLFVPSEILIRDREIALRGENVMFRKFCYNISICISRNAARRGPVGRRRRRRL
jgi:hypothetical protein